MRDFFKRLQIGYFSIVKETENNEFPAFQVLVHIWCKKIDWEREQNVTIICFDIFIPKCSEGGG